MQLQFCNLSLMAVEACNFSLNTRIRLFAGVAVCDLPSSLSDIAIQDLKISICLKNRQFDLDFTDS